jgi:hypothetical protein
MRNPELWLARTTLSDRAPGVGRRALPVVFAAPALAQDAGYRWRVMRQGSEIGSHRVTFQSRGQEMSALSELLITPRVLGVIVYRYEHRYTEVTRAGRFVSVESRFNRNGRVLDVTATAATDAVLLRSAGVEQRLPADAAPLSWWEPQRFGAVPLFGTTDPRLVTLRIRREALPGGGLRIATAGDVEATLDYDSRGRWVGYSVVGDDGSLVTYAPA